MEGLTTAPLTPRDTAEIARVSRACEIHDDGQALFTEEDFVAIAKRPSTDLERHSIGFRDGGELVALALLIGERDVLAYVAPSHRGRRIGSRLLRWTEEAARGVGNARTCQGVSENVPAAQALLESSGYERQWESWVFAIDLQDEPGRPLLPPGYAIRDFDPERDARAAHRVIDDAFREWPDPEEWKYEDWEAEVLGRPGFAPEHVATVVHGDEIAGAAVLIVEQGDVWVAQLAVAKAHRGRGLARALLIHSFGVAWRGGLRKVGLMTDSRTGARGLYDHVGMRVTRTSYEYEKALTSAASG